MTGIIPKSAAADTRPPANTAASTKVPGSSAHPKVTLMTWKDTVKSNSMDSRQTESQPHTAQSESRVKVDNQTVSETKFHNTDKQESHTRQPNQSAQTTKISLHQTSENSTSISNSVPLMSGQTSNANIQTVAKPVDTNQGHNIHQAVPTAKQTHANTLLNSSQKASTVSTVSNPAVTHVISIPSSPSSQIVPPRNTVQSSMQAKPTVVSVSNSNQRTLIRTPSNTCVTVQNSVQMPSPAVSGSTTNRSFVQGYPQDPSVPAVVMDLENDVGLTLDEVNQVLNSQEEIANVKSNTPTDESTRIGQIASYLKEGDQSMQKKHLKVSIKPKPQGQVHPDQVHANARQVQVNSGQVQAYSGQVQANSKQGHTNQMGAQSPHVQIATQVLQSSGTMVTTASQNLQRNPSAPPPQQQQAAVKQQAQPRGVPKQMQRMYFNDNGKLVVDYSGGVAQNKKLGPQTPTPTLNHPNLIQYGKDGKLSDQSRQQPTQQQQQHGQQQIQQHAQQARLQQQLTHQQQPRQATQQSQQQLLHAQLQPRQEHVQQQQQQQQQQQHEPVRLQPQKPVLQQQEEETSTRNQLQQRLQQRTQQLSADVGLKVRRIMIFIIKL